MNAVWKLWLMVSAELVMFSLFWTATARLQKTNRFQGLYFLAGFNFFMAVGLMLVAMRGVWPDMVTKAGASAIELLAISFLWHGGALLIDVPTRREAFFVVAIGSLLTLINQLFNTGQDAMREAILFLCISWILVRAGWCAWDSLHDRDIHQRRAAAILFVLAIITASAMTIRSLTGLWSSNALQLSTESFSTYFTSLSVMLILAITNGMLAYTVVRTLIKELEHQAHHDVLTGLLNRRAFQERHDRQWHAWQRDQRNYALICFDIDHFKSVNDTFGHDAGDCALVAVAQILTQNARPLDSAARIGGEEFVLLLDDISTQQAVDVAERIRLAIHSMPPLPSLPGRSLSVSAGVAAVTSTTQSAGELLKLADQTLYQAKSLGRNRVCLKNSDTHKPELVLPSSCALA